MENIDPATGQVYGSIAAGAQAEVDRAVEAANRAFSIWSKMAPADRSSRLLRLADLIDTNLESLARAESVDTGKPIALARAVDIPRAASNLRYFANAVLHHHSEAYEHQQGASRALSYTLRQPRGVAGTISPWNLPLYLFTWKVAPALATGNTVVAKPSEVTPVTAHRLAALSLEADIPPGVFNIVHGRGDEAGAAIVAHPQIPTITFTGGTATGKHIAATAAPMFKRLALELGGKNPTLVFADCDFETTVSGATRAAFANQGQICLCGSRLLIERSIFEKFTDAFVDRVQSLRQGDPLEESTQQGAVVSLAHQRKVLNAIDVARQEGGTILCGGEAAPAPNDRCRTGYFVKPTVITGLDEHCRTNREEIFGPVVTLMPFDDTDHAIRLANATDYGLAASIWTNNLKRAHHLADRVQAGIIWINCWLVRDLRVPFGGMKQSGVGREGGAEALHFFTEPKSVCLSLDE
ncbi:MAG: aldehyde dehydrogenase [Phycisphaerales bacterium]|nr:MAG: aldehyde dehydrogenase [Phycisphaerales bacterium]